MKEGVDEVGDNFVLGLGEVGCLLKSFEEMENDTAYLDTKINLNPAVQTISLTRTTTIPPL